ISNNVRNGINTDIEGGNIDISSPGNPLTVDFFILGNNLSNNGINGANLHSSGNADFRVTLGDSGNNQGNTINSNGQDGVNASTMAFSQVEGVWQHNIIELNGRFGIGFNDGDQSGTSISVVLGPNNLIEHNTSDGINFQSTPPIPLSG